MRPLLRAVDGERATVDILTALIAPHEPNVDVGVAVPPDWTPSSRPLLQVRVDGTFLLRRIVTRATVRVVARSGSRTRSKSLAALAEGLLLSYEGGPVVSHYRLGTSVLPARDSDTLAELASITVQMIARSTPISSGP